MPPHCPGCNVDCKGGKGLSLHLRLTTNEACRAIFTEAESRIGPLPAKHAQEQQFQERDANFGPPQMHGLPSGDNVFQGDFFGNNYTDEEFGYDLGSEDEFDDEGSDEDEDPSAQDQQDASHAGLEDGYEVPRAPNTNLADSAMPGIQQTAAGPAPNRESRKYPGRSAGKPIPATHSQSSEETYRSSLNNSTDGNPYAPFASKMDWDIAKWAKLRGSGSTAFTDLLQIDGLRDSNKIIDEKLPGRPKFTRSEVVVNGEVFHLYSRDILECVRALWGDTDFAPYLFVAPEKHYIDNGKIRMYHNMHTGKWWWATQDGRLEARRYGAFKLEGRPWKAFKAHDGLHQAPCRRLPRPLMRSTYLVKATIPRPSSFFPTPTIAHPFVHPREHGVPRAMANVLSNISLLFWHPSEFAGRLKPHRHCILKRPPTSPPTSPPSKPSSLQQASPAFLFFQCIQSKYQANSVKSTTLLATPAFPVFKF
ncbi:hypothetical protein B0H11DRAFT_2258450 [Mycena galericulata]|nr:hypothetical protein B0H11DRAFT_2258450 [Mycena galericulata]